MALQFCLGIKTIVSTLDTTKLDRLPLIWPLDPLVDGGGPGSSRNRSEPCNQRVPFKSSRSVVGLCGPAFSSSQTAHLPTRVGLTPAGDSQRASQLTEGGREWKRANTGQPEINARVQIEPKNLVDFHQFLGGGCFAFRLDMRPHLFWVIN